MMAQSCHPSVDSIEQIEALLVINSQPIDAITNIIKQFNTTSQEVKPRTIQLGTDASVDGYDVMIDNKYYSTQICLFDIKDKLLVDKRFKHCVKGVIIYFDLNQESSFDGLESWQTFINQFDTEIKVLVCDSMVDSFVDKNERLVKWCLDNEYELVEMCPQKDVSDLDDDRDDDRDDQPFGNEYGFERISQAIQAFEWPNSRLKDGPQYNPSSKFQQLLDTDLMASIGENSLQQLEECDNDSEDFETLFQKFSEIKMKSSQMNDTNRKEFAEEMTIAFWKAIGGDEQEINGLDSID